MWLCRLGDVLRMSSDGDVGESSIGWLSVPSPGDVMGDGNVLPVPGDTVVSACPAAADVVVSRSMRTSTYSPPNPIPLAMQHVRAPGWNERATHLIDAALHESRHIHGPPFGARACVACPVAVRIRWHPRN